jgi:hypothetical protein
MVKILKAVPVLPALNIRETIDFYVHHLGFMMRHQEDEYGIINRDDVEIHFWRCGNKNIAENSSCRLTVEGVEELYEQAGKASIVHPNAALVTQPWGTREFAILDLNGNLLWFLEPIQSV